MIIWMDNPTQYGGNVGLLLEGPYADASIGIQRNAGPGGVGDVFAMGGTSQVLRKVLPGDRSNLGVGMRVYFPDALPGLNGTTFPISLRDDGNVTFCTVTIQSTGAINVSGNNGLNVTTGPVIVARSFQHIEVYFGLGNDGALRINVNGLPVYSNDNINMPAGPCAQIGTSITSGPNSSPRFWWCDTYIWDDQGALNNAGMQGDRQVLLSLATADGPEQDWDYSVGGSGWPLISNVPPDDSQYIFANIDGQKSDFQFADIDTEITSISACRVVGRVWKSDAGIGTMSLNMISNGHRSAETEQGVSTEPVYYSQIIETDPNTNVKWTPAGVNAALVEIDRIQ